MSEQPERRGGEGWRRLLPTIEVALLMLLFFVWAGDPPPSVNEAHYLVLAKQYWNPQWCAGDPFVASSKPHLLFHFLFGWVSQFVSLEATAWIGRWVGWTMLAIGLRALVSTLNDRFGISLAVAIIWIAGLHRYNLAGEWVIGGIEAKVPAYAFLLLGLRMMLLGRWTWVWPLLGVASAFHVLVGGWAVVAAAPVYLLRGRHQSPLRSQGIPLILGGALAMVGLWPALVLSPPTDSQTATQAARIYTYARLSHHLFAPSFPTTWWVRHAALVLACLLMGWPIRRHDRFGSMYGFTLAVLAIAGVGLALGWMAPLAPNPVARLLRFYWFRSTDAITPLTLGLAIATRWKVPERLATTEKHLWPARLAGLVVLTVALVNVVSATLERQTLAIPPSCRFDVPRVAKSDRLDSVSPSPQDAYEDWLRVCRWVDQTLPRDEVLLTPRYQQSFKWYAQRAEVVNWKDVPQDARSLIRWYQTFHDVFPKRLGSTRVTIRYRDLIHLRESYGARFLIVDRRVSGATLPLVRVYPTDEEEPNETYAVYRLP